MKTILPILGLMCAGTGYYLLWDVDWRAAIGVLLLRISWDIADFKTATRKADEKDNES